MYAGLRRGELVALRVEDIDLAAGVIHVRRGWDAHEGAIATKSGKDRRVPIAGILRDYLDEHLLGLAWSEGLVFGVSGVSPFCDRTLTERSERAWKRAKLKRITLHECRHTRAHPLRCQLPVHDALDEPADLPAGHLLQRAPPGR